MRKICGLVFLIQIVLLIFAAPGICAQNKAGSGERQQLPESANTWIPAKHVILITIKGLNENNFANSFTPNINSIGSMGVKSKAIGVAEKSNVNLVSIYTGSTPLVHGYTGTEGRVKIGTFPDLLAAYGRNAAIVSAGDIQPANLFANKAGIRLLKPKTKTNKAVMSKAISEFINNQPFFIGIHFALDAQNKASDAIAEIDQEVGRLNNTLSQYGVFDQTLIAVVGVDGNKVSPVLMAGPGLKKYAILPPVRLVDIMPTFSAITGMVQTTELDGFVLWSAMQPGNGYTETGLLNKRIKDLSDENMKAAQRELSLTEEKRLAKRDREAVEKQRQAMQETVRGKDGQIRSLQIYIGVLKLIIIAIVTIMGIGYGIQYLYLRKKFLMF